MLNQQKITYILEMHKWLDSSFMLNQQKGHIQAGNAQMRQDGQTGHSCSINKKSCTSWKCTQEARWSDRSMVSNQQKVTYILEIG